MLREQRKKNGEKSVSSHSPERTQNGLLIESEMYGNSLAVSRGAIEGEKLMKSEGK